jgi:hypothetical protein
MAHFAELDENNIVIRVTVVNNSEIKNQYGRESEAMGIAFCKALFGEATRWVQTSYNGKTRGKYAAIGDRYDQTSNTFVPPI